MLRVRLPRIKEADKIWPRVVASVPVLILLCHARQPGGLTGKLSKCYPADIPASRQLGDIFGNRVIEAQLALLNGFRERRCRKQLAHGTEVEDRLLRDSTILRVVGKAIVEERGRAIHSERHRNASSFTILRQYRLNFLRDDLFNVDLLSARRTRSQENPDHSRNEDAFYNHGRDSSPLDQLAQRRATARFARSLACSVRHALINKELVPSFYRHLLLRQSGNNLSSNRS